MKNNCQFTFANIEHQYRVALDAGYEFITCEELVVKKQNLPDRTIVNRVDIDLSIKKADRLRDIFDRLGIKATFLSVCTHLNIIHTPLKIIGYLSQSEMLDMKLGIVVRL